MRKVLKFGVETVDEIRATINMYDEEEPASLVKEVAQNADDAGATELHITMDWRSHETADLPVKLARCQGPALVVRNNRPFSEQDLDSIGRILRGSKKDEAGKVGRYGRGFLTVFNVTDYPAFVTRDSLFLIDPTENFIDARELPDVWQNLPECGRAFAAAGLPNGCIDFNEVVFRLPLRDIEQATTTSPLKPIKPFARDDFEKMVRGAVELGAPLLLFAKSLESIQIDEIPNEPGAKRRKLWRMEIDEDTLQQVREARQGIKQALEGPAIVSEVYTESRAIEVDRMIAHWAAAKGASRSWRQTMVFSGSTIGRRKQETWLVAGGLYASDKSVLEEARQLWLKGDKAVPLGGAAVEVVSTPPVPKASKAGWICSGFPIDTINGLPVHLNGAVKPDAGRMAVIRHTWNDTIMGEVVSRAYLDLLAEVRSTCQATAAKEYYQLWPLKAELLATEATQSLVTTILKRLCDGSCTSLAVRSKAGNEWITPGKLRLPLQPNGPALPGWFRKLDEPLIELGFPQPSPDLPPDVAACLQARNALGAMVTPEDVRKKLRMDTDVACELVKAPHTYLRDREQVLLLFQFCVSDGPPGKNDQLRTLVGLPLAIACDGKLHTFGRLTSRGGTAFCATEQQKQLLEAEFKSWFVEDRVYEELLKSKSDWGGLKRMGHSDLLESLADLFKSKYPVKAPPWGTNAWILLFVKYVMGMDKLTAPRASLLQQIRFVPQRQTGVWLAGCLATTPLIPLEGNNPESLINALSACQIPIVTEEPEVLEAMRSLCRKCADPLFCDAASSRAVHSLSAVNLVKTMVYLAHEFGKSAGAKSPQLCAEIVNFLCTEDKRFDDGAANVFLELLKSLPFLPTNLGTVVAATNKDLRFASDFELPEFASQIPLVKVGHEAHHRSFLTRLGIKELTFDDFVNRHLKYAFDKGNDVVRAQAALWLRDTVLKLVKTSDEAASPDQPGENRALKTIKRRLPIFRCTNGTHCIGVQLHDPDSKDIQLVLQQDARVPDLEYYLQIDKSRERWMSFFQTVGMHKSPNAYDVVNRVNEVLKRSETDGVNAVAGVLDDLLSFVMKNWETLQKDRFDKKGDQDEEPVKVIDKLKEKAWIVGYQGTGILPDFSSPAGLFKPSEVATRKLAPIVGSGMPVTSRKGSEDIEGKIGLRMYYVMPRIVLQQFHRILEAIQQSRDPSAEQVEILEEIYDHVGKMDLDKLNQERQLWQSLKDRPSIWDAASRKLWLPAHVFASDTSKLFGHRRLTLREVDSNAKAIQRNKVYTFLGRADEPGPDDYLDYLEQLSNEHGEKPLGSDEQYCVRRVLLQLELECEDFKDQYENSGLFIPTQEWVLHRASDVFYDDDPRTYDRKGLYILNQNLSDVENLVRSFGISRLSECVTCDLRQHPTESAPSDDKGTRRCQDLAKLIPSTEFMAGMRRLLAAEDTKVDEELLGRIRDLQIRQTNSIPVVFRLKSNKAQIGLGSQDAWCNGTTLWVVPTDEQSLLCGVLVALNTLLGQHQLRETLPLFLMLSAAPDEIDRVLNRAHVRINRPSDETELELLIASSQSAATAAPLVNDVVPGVSIVPRVSSGNEVSSRHIPDLASLNAPEMPPRVKGGTGTSYWSETHSSDVDDPDVDDFDVDDSREFEDDNTQPRWGGSLVRSKAFGVSGTVGRRPVTGDPDVARWALANMREVPTGILEQIVWYERRHQGKAEITSGNLNFQITSLRTGKSGIEQREILVRLVIGTWEESGLRLLATELDYALKHPKTFWVYVVDCAEDSRKTRIREFHRIARSMKTERLKLITQYRVPCSLLPDGTPIEELSLPPEIGNGIKLEPDLWCRIIDRQSDPTGELLIVQPLVPNTERLNVRYNGQQICDRDVLSMIEMEQYGHDSSATD